MKKKPTKSRIVRFTYDPDNPPMWTAEDKARFDAIRDEDIDTSDIPDLSTLTGWTRPGALIPPSNKESVTVRYDADVIAFFKKTGKKYQSRMNAVLREYMLAQKRHTATTAPRSTRKAAKKSKAA